MKATLDNDTKLRNAEYTKEKLDNGGRLLISITHTSRSNLSYRFKVWLAYADEYGQIQTMSLNYWLASITKQSLTNTDELKAGGLGFDRYLDVALGLGHIFESYGLAKPEERYGYKIKYSAIN